MAELLGYDHTLGLKPVLALVHDLHHTFGSMKGSRVLHGVVITLDVEPQSNGTGKRNT